MDRLFRVITYFGAAVLMFLALFTVTDVVLRYFFNRPISGGFELSELVLSVIVAPSLVAATASREHISVDVFYEKMPLRMRLVLNMVAPVVGIVVLALLMWQGGGSFLHSARAGEYTDMLRAPIYPFRLILLIGFFFSLLALVRGLVLSMRAGGREPSGEESQAQKVAALEERAYVE